MEITYATKAIIFKSYPLNEFDSLIICYTEEKGKLELIAKAVKKTSSKLSGHLQSFNLVDLMVIKGKNRNYAGAVSNLDSYLNLKQDLEKLKVSGYVIRVANKLLKVDEPDPEIFVLLKEFLQVLENIKSQPNFYLFLSNITLLKLIILLGYQPKIDTQAKKISFLYDQNNFLNILPQDMFSVFVWLMQAEFSQITQINFSKQDIGQLNTIITRIIALVLEN